MHENDVAKRVIDTSYHIHVELGPGLLESVYEEILFYELLQQGFTVDRQKSIPVIWKEVKMDLGFRSDLIVNEKVIVELKAVEKIAPLHKKQPSVSAT